MLSEIHQQPKATAETLVEAFRQARHIVRELDASKLSMVYFTGSGTSYHACLGANYALSTLTRISSTTLPASEFASWVSQTRRPGTALVAISQSGESVDVLAAVKAANTAGIRTIAVTNSARSSLTDQTDFQFVARAGKERAVTATKSFTATLAATYTFVLEVAKAVAPGAGITGRLEQSLRTAPKQMQFTISVSENYVRALATKFADKQLYFILGSGPNFPTALEGALKLKESSNLYAEGFASREFLHGPMQLVDSRTPIFLLQGLEESEQIGQLAKSFVKFGSATVVIKRKTAHSKAHESDTVDVAPGIEEIFSPLVYVIPLQLYAFYAALKRGLNPDSPVKLTKVVR